MGVSRLPSGFGPKFCFDIVEPCFYVQEQGGDLEAGSLQSSDVVGQGEARVVGAKTRE